MKTERTFIIGTLVLLSILILIGCRQEELANPKGDKVRLTAPQAHEIIKSPLIITGQARGTWYFEASFPIRLLDDKGTELAATPSQAQGEWMTENFVPFTATLEFQTAAKTGTLVLQKDNPSELPEHDDEFRLPVRFE